VLAIAVVALRAKLRIETFALSLVAGGAVGNVVDRIRLGAVVDYIDFYYASWHWPTFNLADVFISLGVALFIGTSLVCGKKDARTA
jgi:signal peptidase II